MAVPRRPGQMPAASAAAAQREAPEATCRLAWRVLHPSIQEVKAVRDNSIVVGTIKQVDVQGPAGFPRSLRRRRSATVTSARAAATGSRRGRSDGPTAPAAPRTAPRGARAPARRAARQRLSRLRAPRAAPAPPVAACAGPGSWRPWRRPWLEEGARQGGQRCVRGLHPTARCKLQTSKRRPQPRIQQTPTTRPAPHRSGVAQRRASYSARARKRIPRGLVAPCGGCGRDVWDVV